MTGAQGGAVYQGATDAFAVEIRDIPSGGLLVKARYQDRDYTLHLDEQWLNRIAFARDQSSYQKLSDSLAIKRLADGSMGLCSTLEGLTAQNKPLPQGGEQVKEFFSSLKSGGGDFQSFITEALIHLCATKPVGLDAVKSLGEWILANNPNQPRVEAPEN